MPPIPHRRNRTTIVLLLIIVILLLILGIVCYRCHKPGKSCSTCPADTVHWVQWNILFKPNTPLATRAQIANEVDDSLRKLLVVGYGIDTTNIHPIFTHYFCPCDTTLLNVDLTLINESGNPVTPSSPTKNPPPPPIGTVGGSVFALNFFNNPMTVPEFTNAQPLKNNPFPNAAASNDSGFFSQNLHGPYISDKVLALLDTGLDSTEFHKKIGDSTYNYTSEISALVWKDPSGNTLYNTLVGDIKNSLTDDETTFKHGTSVAYIALQAATHNNLGGTMTPPLPHLMILKVLDSLGRGSVFTISCAMSYAIQKHATVINTSLGYYGPSDPILEHYFRKASDSAIPVMVAAGNDTSHPHQNSMLCTSTINVTGAIGSTNSFYPACFSRNMPYVTTVTGISHVRPCYYQNYSDSFVNIGVDIQLSPGANGQATNQTCCAFYIPYLNDGEFVEGSSFSTPVITGSYLYTICGPGRNLPPPPPATWLTQFNTNQPPLKKYTLDGRYFTYFYQ